MISRERLYILGGLFFIVLAAYTITTLIVSGDDSPKKQTVVRINSSPTPAEGVTPAEKTAPEADGQATLAVVSTPAGAKLQFNGDWEFETTPTRIKVNAGEPIKDRIAQQRYRKNESTITLRPGEVRSSMSGGPTGRSIAGGVSAEQCDGFRGWYGAWAHPRHAVQGAAR